MKCFSFYFGDSNDDIFYDMKLQRHDVIIHLKRNVSLFLKISLSEKFSLRSIDNVNKVHCKYDAVRQNKSSTFNQITFQLGVSRRHQIYLNISFTKCAICSKTECFVYMAIDLLIQAQKCKF